MGITAVVRTQTPLRAKTLTVGLNPRLTNLADVDSTELSEGSLLVYNATTGKFQTKPELDNSSTTIIGGKY